MNFSRKSNIPLSNECHISQKNIGELMNSIISWIMRCFLANVKMNRWLSDCIRSGYEMMIDGYYDNDKQPLEGFKKTRIGTIPKTFIVPTKGAKTLRWFSKTLNVRTSHLVTICVLNSECGDLGEKSKRLEELIKIADEIS